MTDFTKIAYTKLTHEQKLELVELIKKYYIDENLSEYDTAIKIGYKSRTPIRHALDEFNLRKSKEMMIKSTFDHRDEVSISEKRKSTMKERYGYEQPFSVPEIRNKCL